MKDAVDGWVQNPNWEGEAEFAHGTLMRQEDVTEGKLPMSQSLARAERFIRKLTAGPRRAGEDESSPITLIGADQVHGDHIEVIASEADRDRANRLPIQPDAAFPGYEFPETDGLITTLRRTMLVIQTADCLPILYRDLAGGMIGACHCGWRGLYAGLARKTAERMIALGARAEQMEAWIGPGIRFENYEVGTELVEKFRQAFPASAVSSNGTHLDLAQIAADQLLAAGLRVVNVADSCQCTFRDPRLFHSYRRDGPKAGRLLTVIMNR